MSLNDPIADMLTRIRNGLKANFSRVSCPYSKVNHNILKVMLQEGYIEAIDIEDVPSKKKNSFLKNLIIKLKYYNNTKVIKSIQRVSKSGNRVYTSAKGKNLHYNGLGILVLTTPKGVMSSYEASSKNLGGEILCSIY